MNTMTQDIDGSYVFISPNDAGVRDFSSHINVKFQIDGELFEGVAGIPALSLLEFGVLYDGMSETDIMKHPDTFTRMIDLVLTDDSAARFKSRMTDKKRPVSMAQLMDLLPWLMEQYGLRPSQPSSSSPAGSDSQDDGTSSTDKQYAEVSNLLPLTQQAS